jgi:hypothetical protein
VTIMAGDGDRVVSYRLAERLNAAISGSSLQIIQGCALAMPPTAGLCQIILRMISMFCVCTGQLRSLAAPYAAQHSGPPRVQSLRGSSYIPQKRRI